MYRDTRGLEIYGTRRGRRVQQLERSQPKRTAQWKSGPVDGSALSIMRGGLLARLCDLVVHGRSAIEVVMRWDFWGRV